MKNKLLLPLLGVLAALVVFAWTSLVSDPAAAGGAPPVELTPDGDPLPLAGGAPPQLPAPEAPREVVVDRQEEPAAQPPPDPVIRSAEEVASNAVWISGRIVFPPKLPSDGGEVEVTARGRRFGGNQKRSDARREYSTRSKDDGTFRVAFAKDTRKGWIDIEGRYVYLPERHRVDMRRLPSEVVIEPKLGGILTGTISLPIGVEWNEPNRDQTHVRIYSWGSGQMVTRRAAIDEEGRYELLGVPPGAEYHFNVESELWCGFEKSGVSVKAGEVTYLDAELTPGATVTGRVVDAKGLGASRVPVELICDPLDDGWHRQSKQTEKDGSFRFHGIVAGSVRLRAGEQEHLTVEKELGDLRPGDRRTDVVLALDEGLAISGVVVWPDGRPAAGAVITVDQDREVRGVGFGFGDTRSEQAAADGSFRVTGLEDSPCVVRARVKSVRPEDRERAEERAAEGKDPRLRRRGPTYTVKAVDVPPGTTGLRLALELGDSLSGRVVDDRGEPLTRFLIRAMPVQDGGSGLDGDDALNRIVVTLDGEFTVDGLRDGTWKITARATGHARSNEVVVTSPGAGEVELIAPRLAEVHGVVRDAGGAPVSGATVWIEDAQDAEGQHRVVQLRGGTWGGAATTDEEGRFEAADVTPGRKNVNAGFEGAANSAPVQVDVKPGGQVTGVVCQLREAARISGRIHAAAGEVAERSVRVRGLEGVSYWDETETSASGSFEVTGLNPGTYELTLEASSTFGDEEEDWELRQARSSAEKVTLREGEHAHVVLGAPPSDPIRVRGRVTCGGEPVAGAVVTCRASGAHEGKAAGRTDGEGVYTMTLAEAGKYRFEVGEVGTDRMSFHRDVPRSAEVVIDFELPTASISGIVRDDTGAPRAGCQVQLEYGGLGEKKEGAGSRRSVETDSEGGYRLDHLRAGTYHVRVAPHRRWRWGGSSGPALGAVILEGLEVAEGEQRTGLDFDLEVGGSVAGVVLGADGLPASGARVEVQTESGRSVTGFGRSSTGSGGRFDQGGLAPGRYRVRAWKGQEKSDPVAVRVYSSSTAEVELVLEGG